MARERPRLSVVVPAYNEAARVASTLEELAAFLHRLGISFEIRVVDDGSTDGTAAIVERHAALDRRIVVQREPHRGKGGAVKAGMLAAGGDLRFLCDADLSMPVSELPRLLEPQAAGVDVAIGSREGHGARRVGEPLRRHVTGRIFNRAVQYLALPGIEDSQCGFKMFTARAADAIFPLVTVSGWAFDIEVLYIARHLGFRVLEVPIEWHYRQASHLSVLRDSGGMLREVLRIRARARRGEYGPPGEPRQR
jgi:dolichyl-phosphate beta-glucosyltransferase